MKVLVVGGAGYIGAHMCKYLWQHGHESVVFDNLSTGHREAVKWSPFFQGDMLCRQDLEKVFDQLGPFDLVMHFGAKSIVGESMADPALYYQNNVAGSLNLFDVMLASGHNKLVFSSSAAVYGKPEVDLIAETQVTAPINSYGRSKLLVENMLKDYADAYGLNSVSLRYFNACGADPEGEIGESHHPETHLIPNILISEASGSADALKVFGQSYPTRDGTCIRDYIHIIDLAFAHLLASDFLQHHVGAYSFNLGNGNGFSVLEVIHAAERVIGKKIEFEFVDARAGDSPVLVADASLAREMLDWRPMYRDIESIMATAWQWHKNQWF